MNFGNHGIGKNLAFWEIFNRTRTNLENPNGKSLDLHQSNNVIHPKEIVPRLNRFYSRLFSKYLKFEDIFQLCYSQS